MLVTKQKQHLVDVFRSAQEGAGAMPVYLGMLLGNGLGTALTLWACLQAGLWAETKDTLLTQIVYYTAANLALIALPASLFMAWITMAAYIAFQIDESGPDSNPIKEQE